MHDSYVNITKTNNGIVFPTSLTTQKATVIKRKEKKIQSALSHLVTEGKDLQLA